MTAPQEPAEAAEPDEVVDGELVETPEQSGDQHPADHQDPADDQDVVQDADTVDPASQAVSGGVPAGTPPVPIAAPAFDYTDDGVPTLDYVRDKIEGRWGTALGSTELAEASQPGRAQQDAAEERARLAAEKLAEIRRQVGGGGKD
jgi:hypothetical protein